ncbi:hypothetical protein BJ138DRAFT_1105698 [Hygrophoropsis aurantiaca]|uniref:Uncharacterized protein n=1 Tax=Hygrophoropsis aurantiaca TaxID=72124 RepID=A0ACB7ZY31_9AGAM|nr:hypothetical protein BJ138DRAFT_1105698 [Hygrophoropsis aurantiaca]
MVANAGINRVIPLIDVKTRGTFICYKYAAQQMMQMAQGLERRRMIEASSLAGKTVYTLIRVIAPSLDIHCFDALFRLASIIVMRSFAFVAHALPVNIDLPPEVWRWRTLGQVYRVLVIFTTAIELQNPKVCHGLHRANLSFTEAVPAPDFAGFAIFIKPLVERCSLPSSMKSSSSCSTQWSVFVKGSSLANVGTPELSRVGE